MRQREGKAREGKGSEGKGREAKESEGKRKKAKGSEGKVTKSWYIIEKFPLWATGCQSQWDTT